MKSRYGMILLLFVVVCILIWELGSHTDINNGYELQLDQLIFKMAEHRTEVYPTNEGAHLFSELVEERTDGRVKILIYDGYELGDESSIIEQVAFGGIDFARVSGVYLDEYLSETSVFSLPGLYEDNASLMKVLNDAEIGTRMSESLKNEKINILTWYPGSTRGIFYNEMNYEALNNGKIAIPTSQMKIVEMEVMGFQPIPTIQDNINSYLAGAYVVGAEGELIDYYYNKSYNKAKHFTKTQSRIPEAIVASNTALKQLTVEQQQIVAQAAIEAGLSTSERIVQQEASIALELLSLGCIVDDIDRNEAYIKAMSQLETVIGDSDVIEQIRLVLEN